MTSFLRNLLLAGVALAASTGCVREQGPSNGEGGALEFTVESDATDSTVLATGFATEIDVTRYDSYWQCPDLSKSVPVGTHTAGVRAQSCGANPEPVSVIDARCDDGACTVVPKPADGSGVAKLVVTGLRDGAATLHVDVKSTTSGATWGDSFAMQFSTAKRIAIVGETSDTANTSYASMPGASFSWCPELRDASETKLAAPRGAIASSVTGDSGVVVFADASTTYVTPGCTSFTGAQPGKTSVVFTAQSLTASGDVRIANPNDIVGADLYAVISTTAADAGSSSGSNEIGTAPPIGASPVTSIDLTLEDTFVDYASVLRLRDGTRAIGGAGNYKSSSEETLSVTGEGSDPEIAQGYLTVLPLGNVIGDGTIDATFGAVKASVPFHITR